MSFLSQFPTSFINFEKELKELEKQFEEFRKQIEQQIEQLRLQFKSWWYSLPPETRMVLTTVLSGTVSGVAGTLFMILFQKLIE